MRGRASEPISSQRNVFCGADWAEDHHDIAIIDTDGTLLAKARIGDDAAGLAQLLGLLAERGDSSEDPIPVAIETNRGLLVACLRATGRRVFAINPLAVARYRERYSVARKKSDAIDAAALANILRTDINAHRSLPADSELAQAVAMLARAQRDAVWDRTQAHNKLRSQLREYFPAFLAAFADKDGGIMRAEARIILAAASTPADAARLTTTRLLALLRKARRVRGIEAEAKRLRGVFRAEQMRQMPLVEQAFGRQSLALLRTLGATCTNAEELEQATVQAFAQHPDASIITSFPGLGMLTGASGKSHHVMHRKIKNQRLAAVGYVWAFSALTASPGARAHYDRRKGGNERHVAAQRNLFNRLLGMLYHCLQTGVPYNEAIAFPAASPTTTSALAA